MEYRLDASDSVRRLGWSLFLLGSPLGNTTIGLALLFVASLIRAFRPLGRSERSGGTEGSGPREATGRPETTGDTFFYAAYAFLGAALISAIGSQRPDIALLTAFGFWLILHLILHGTAYLLGPSAPIPLRQFVPWILALGAAGTLFAVVRDVSRGFLRVGGWLGPNGLGGLAAFFALLALVYAFSERRTRFRLLGAAACLVQLVGLALSMSRGAWLGFLASLAALAVLLARVSRKHLRQFGWILVGVLVVALLAAILYPPLYERALEMVSLKSNMDRLYVWSAAVRMVADRPLTGVGGGNFPFVYVDYRPEGEQRTTVSFSHNLFLHILAEYGLLGLIPFTWMIGAALRRGWRVARGSDLLLQGAYAGYIGFIVHDMVDNVTHGMNIGGLFWLLTGLFVHLGRERSAAP